MGEWANQRFTRSSNEMPSALTTRRAWIAWLAICLIWGTTYLAIKIALESVPPFLMGGFRYVFGGTILTLLLFATGRRLPPASHWPMQVLLGFSCWRSATVASSGASSTSPAV